MWAAQKARGDSVCLSPVSPFSDTSSLGGSSFIVEAWSTSGCVMSHRSLDYLKNIFPDRKTSTSSHCPPPNFGRSVAGSLWSVSLALGGWLFVLDMGEICSRCGQ